MIYAIPAALLILVISVAIFRNARIERKEIEQARERLLRERQARGENDQWTDME